MDIKIVNKLIDKLIDANTELEGAMTRDFENYTLRELIAPGQLIDQAIEILSLYKRIYDLEAEIKENRNNYDSGWLEESYRVLASLKSQWQDMAAVDIETNDTKKGNE